VTFNKQALEDAFDDLGWYDLLSKTPFLKEHEDQTVRCESLSDEMLKDLGWPHLKEESENLALRSVAISIVDQAISSWLHQSAKVWEKRLLAPLTPPAETISKKFVEMIYGCEFGTETILICSSELFQFLQLHPKASTGVANTFHILGNRIIRVQTTAAYGKSILIPKNIIHLKESEMPDIGYEVLSLPDIPVFSIGVPS
jgi:hypothetical protein